MTGGGGVGKRIGIVHLLVRYVCVHVPEFL